MWATTAILNCGLRSISAVEIQAEDKEGLVKRVIEKCVRAAAWASTQTVKMFGYTRHSTIEEEHDWLTAEQLGGLTLTARLTMEDGASEEIEVSVSAVACREWLNHYQNSDQL